MCLEIRKLSVNDGRDLYEMLQELPAEENGFINSVKGKTFDEYKECPYDSLLLQPYCRLVKCQQTRI